MQLFIINKYMMTMFFLSFFCRSHQPCQSTSPVRGTLLAMKTSPPSLTNFKCQKTNDHRARSPIFKWWSSKMATTSRSSVKHRWVTGSMTSRSVNPVSLSCSATCPRLTSHPHGRAIVWWSPMPAAPSSFARSSATKPCVRSAWAISPSSSSTTRPRSSWRSSIQLQVLGTTWHHRRQALPQQGLYSARRYIKYLLEWIGLDWIKYVVVKFFCEAYIKYNSLWVLWHGKNEKTSTLIFYLPMWYTG